MGLCICLAQLMDIAGAGDEAKGRFIGWRCGQAAGQIRIPPVRKVVCCGVVIGIPGGNKTSNGLPECLLQLVMAFVDVAVLFAGRHAPELAGRFWGVGHMFVGIAMLGYLDDAIGVGRDEVGHIVTGNGDKTIRADAERYYRDGGGDV